MSDKPLHWVQLHVSALSIGHHQVVLRLIEHLYHKQSIRGWLGGWWSILTAETCSCTQCSGLSLIDNTVALWL